MTKHMRLAPQMFACVDDPMVADALAASAHVIDEHRIPTDRLIRLVILHTNDLERLGLAALFGRARRCHVIADVGTGEEALQVLRRTPADVVLMTDDVDDREDAGAIIRQVCRAGVSAIVLGTGENPVSIVAAIRAGAAGYLLRHPDAAHIVDAVETVAGGGMYVSPAASELVTGWFRSGQPSADPLDALSRRERRIAQLIAQGKTNRTIAGEECLRELTVKTYVSSILRKLGYTRRAQIAVAAARYQLEPE